MYSTADFTGPDPDLWARITGAVTAAEAEEGFRIFGEKLARFVEDTEGGTVLKDPLP